MLMEYETENTQNTKKYIGDEIGEEYMRWEPGDTIFISAPTGSGKSHFILYTFLKYAIEKKMKILYMVNRKVLKEQMEEELKNDVEKEVYRTFRKVGLSVREYIEVMTYQNLEDALRGNEPWTTINKIRTFDCVVCDEAHYFYTDSNFNTYTQLSYDCVCEEFADKIRILMSATLDNVKEFMQKHNVLFLPNKNYSTEIQFKMLNKSEYSYSVSENHMDIQVLLFEKQNQLLEQIRKGAKTDEKWLIFVDNIDNGRSMQKGLIEKNGENGISTFSESEVVFVDAKYEKEEEARSNVEEIIEKQCASAKIIISTSVMDNGISFHDEKLRNLVIMSDTKETFLQMLGRKRKDGKKINLYICKRDANHFKKRMQEIEKILECYYRSKYYLENMCIRKADERIYVNPYTDILNRLRFGMKMWKKEGMGMKLESINFSYDYEWILKNQQEVLKRMFSNRILDQYIKKFCYVMGGTLAINSFAIFRCYELRDFYEMMIEAIEKDENAFVKQQADWIGISESVIENAISDMEQKYRIKLKESIEKLGDSFGIETNQKWKNENKTVLLYFANKNLNCTQTDKNDINKINRPISPERFNKCMESARIPFRMKKEGRSIFIIEKCSENSNLQTPKQ